MDQHDSPSGFVPDAYDRSGRQAKAGIISTLSSRWRIPAAATGMAAIAALCLHTGSAAHAATASAAAKPAGLVAHSATDAGGAASLKGHIEDAAATSSGAVRGAFNLYTGSGGGIEFWFTPGSGALTVAVGDGTGAAGGGTIGAYASGSPVAGTDVYADVTLAAGTYASTNLLGSYTYTNGVFSGSVSLTVEGRTLTISSDGSTYFEVNVYPAAGAAGFTGIEGENYTYVFSLVSVDDYVWTPIEEDITSPYSLDDSYTLPEDTTVYYDDSYYGSTDGSSSDSSSDDASDDSGDSGDGGDGGGCSFSTTILPDHASTTVTPQEDEDDAPIDLC